MQGENQPEETPQQDQDDEGVDKEPSPCAAEMAVWEDQRETARALSVLRRHRQHTGGEAVSTAHHMVPVEIPEQAQSETQL